MTIDDPKQLTTYYTVDATIKILNERLEAYDILDVFNIVYPYQNQAIIDLKQESGELVTANLLE
jgi:hypothetical protein